MNIIIFGIMFGFIVALILNIIIKVMLSKILIIGTASRIAVISGAGGFKLINVGEFGLCIPFLNKVSWLDISAMIEEVRVENVISKGGTPVSMDSMVIYGIGSNNPDDKHRVVGNAIRSSLSKTREQISKQIKEILEGNFRETIVGMTPEQLINDKKEFNDRIMAVAQEDLESIGFKLYDVKIKDIWDNKGYLKTLTKKGVQKITAQMDVIEKQCDSEAFEREAENQRLISVSTSNMNQSIIEKEKELEILRREKNGKLDEAKKLAKQKIAKTHAENTSKIEKANIDVQKIVQRFTISLPAEIQKRTEEILAEGNAENTKIIGEAQNLILNKKLALLSNYGKEGLVPFLLNKMQNLSVTYQKSLKDVAVGKITIIGSKEGESAYSLAANMGPSALLKHLKNINEAFGLDAKSILTGQTIENEEVQ